MLCFTFAVWTGSRYALFGAAYWSSGAYVARSASGMCTLLTTRGFLEVHGAVVLSRKRSSSFTAALTAVSGLRFFTTALPHPSRRCLQWGRRLDQELVHASGAHVYSRWHAIRRRERYARCLSRFEDSPVVAMPSDVCSLRRVRVTDY